MPFLPRPLKLTPAVRTTADLEAVEAALAYWSVQDVEMTCSLFAEDIVYQLYVSRSARPFGIERTGRDAVRAMLYDMLAEFDYLSCKASILQVSSGVARIQQRYALRHRTTGEELAGSKRFVCTLKNGLFTRIHEYHDAALVEAFMKLAKWRSNETAAPLWSAKPLP